MPADRHNNSDYTLNQRCLAVAAQLFEYVDTTLSPLDMQSVDAHLAGCEKCRLELEEIRLAEGALVGAPLSIPPPGNLYAGFADKLTAQMPKPRSVRLPYLVSGLAMAALAILFFRPAHPSHTQRPGTRPTEVAVNLRVSKSGTARSTDVSHNLVAAFKSHVSAKMPSTHLVTHLVLSDTVSAPSRIRHKIVELRPGPAFAVVRARRENRRVVIGGLAVSISNSLLFAENLPYTDRAGDRQYDYRAPIEQDGLGRSLRARDGLSFSIGPDQLTGLGVWSADRANEAADQAAGFALVVQDDVRGFTAEAHNAESFVQPALHTAGSVDDGVKVEVEFDGAAGATSF